VKKVLIIKDRLKPSCDKFIFCTPFYTVNCIDYNIISRISDRRKLLITSRNGAIALIANLKIFNCMDLYKDKEIIAVGSQTYNILEPYNFSRLIGPYYNIESLILSERLYQSLYLSGFNTAFDDFAVYDIEREIIYKAIENTIPFNITQQVINGYISNILLYSCRGANIFLKSFPMNYDFHGIKFICISQAVASIVDKYNPQYPAKPIESEMLTLID
jgi:uroporphyrinogen-III synthase